MSVTFADVYDTLCAHYPALQQGATRTRALLGTYLAEFLCMLRQLRC